MTVTFHPDGRIINSNGVEIGSSKMMDQWRLTQSKTIPANTTTYLDSNWERNDNNFAQIGTGMSESSGVFTFPSTGLYRIDARWNVYNNSGTSNRYVSARMELSTDSGSSYAVCATAYTSMSDLGETLGHSTHDVCINVTNASTFRIRIATSSNHQCYYAGNQWGGIAANSQTCCMTFTKLSE